jgi:hypothetical protein
MMIKQAIQALYANKAVQPQGGKQRASQQNSTEHAYGRAATWPSAMGAQKKH